MKLWVYAGGCVLLPSLWAVAVFYLFGWIDRRRSPAAQPPRPKDDELPPVDYMI